MQRTDLDPWRVIRGMLSRLRSYDVPDVIERAGLSVDWSISAKQDWSDGTRFAAYRPRIDAAYDALASDDDRLRVSFMVAHQLAERGLADELNKALGEIGWKIQDAGLTPADSPVRELFFPPQRQHDAYVEIRAILQKATTDVTIVDAYIDESILTLMTACVRPEMTVRLLGAKLQGDFSLESKKWIAQNAGVTLQVRTTRKFHDRFIVLDTKECWHIGCSIKDAGNKAFMLSKGDDDDNRIALIAGIEKTWAGATTV